ncbi:hypothetical protein GCM10010503_04950 [Streptomyces lucensis JCM 4490]|uniref:THIF-type NAD/FAD binding fold domain-containing protein n=1 Tax=Streptomyces lucensis JCM 4490 TaxID=1306176 RepID=A0A918IVC9_9ACTN|nr:HesA/MoeB/ThiF family protein [Streptomyces lucensis]GGW32201.1 hypothetical protein GCM10010503_04950 [Streptomyces lucensis JCM 4490]
MKLPRIKAEHAPHRFDDGTVRLGGGVYGVAAEIADPHGWIWEALALLDGTASPDRIERRLADRYPALGAAGAHRLLTELLATGYVEDAAAVPPEGLTARERDRYSRNHTYFRYVDLRPGTDAWTSQLRLKHARVTVLGVGGAGSHAAWSLAAAGVGELHLVDPDRVEESNLSRQALYTEADIGRPKAETAARRLAAVNSAGRYTHEARRADTEEQLTELVRGRDVFVLCADEPRGDVIRKMTNRVCAALGTPWVSAGYSGPLATVGVYAPGGPCFECVGAGEEAKLKPGWTPHLGTAGALAPAAGISGQLIAHEVISLLTGIGTTPPGFVRGVNLIAPDQHVFVRHPARPDCPLCRP